MMEKYEKELSIELRKETSRMRNDPEPQTKVKMFDSYFINHSKVRFLISLDHETP